jgi:hypothetical protein
MRGILFPLAPLETNKPTEPIFYYWLDSYLALPIGRPALPARLYVEEQVDQWVHI